MPQKSLKKNAAFNFFKAFLTFAFPIITFPYASRVLLPQGIGKVTFANSIVSYFSIIANFGISDYAARGASRMRDDTFALNKFCKEILLLNSFTTAIAYILLFITWCTTQKLHDYSILIAFSSLNLLSNTIGMAWLYVSQEEFQYLTISSFFFHVISIIFLFVFVKTTDDVVYYMLFGIIIAVGPNIYNLFNIKKKINLFQKCTLEIKKHIKPTSVFFAMSVAASIYIMLDTVMLGFLTNDAEVGYYTAATKINKMVAGIFAAVTGVLLPRLTYYVEKKENERIQSLVEKSFSITILLVLPATAGLFLLANPLVLLFSGANYAPAIVPMKIMTPVIIMIAIASFTGTQLLPALGKEKISLYSYIIGATVNSTFNFIFIPKLGAAGAGIATVIAESLVTFTQTIYCFKMFNSKSLVHTILRNMAHAIIGTVIMSLCVLCILFFTTNTILQIALSIITGITVYAIFLHLIQNMFFRNICSAIKQKLPK